MFYLLGLPRSARACGTAAAFLFGAIWWAWSEDPAGPKIVKDLAPYVQIFALVGLGFVFVFFLADWSFEFQYRRVRKLGRDLRDLGDRIIRAHEDRERTKLPPVHPAGGVEQWRVDRDFDRLTSLWLASTFSPEVNAALIRLKRYGVEPPWIARVARNENLVPTAKYFSTIGELLKADELCAARDQKNEDKFWFQVH